MRAIALLIVALVLLAALQEALARPLSLKSVHSGERLTLWETGPSAPPPSAWRRANRVFRSRKTRRRRTIHPRLLRTLAHLQAQFGGRPMELVSGYRQPAATDPLTSYHQVGRAADVRLRGVDDRTLFEACRRLPRVGCGYYPRARFVHIDVRGTSALWVDLSAPGEPRRYVARPRRWLRHRPAGRARSP